jgi:hypothetical protein
MSKEEGFFDVYRKTIEKKLHACGLCRQKSTKKLGITNIQKA